MRYCVVIASAGETLMPCELPTLGDNLVDRYKDLSVIVRLMILRGRSRVRERMIWILRTVAFRWFCRGFRLCRRALVSLSFTAAYQVVQRTVRQHVYCAFQTQPRRSPLPSSIS